MSRIRKTIAEKTLADADMYHNLHRAVWEAGGALSRFDTKALKQKSPKVYEQLQNAIEALDDLRKGELHKVRSGS